MVGNELALSSSRSDSHVRRYQCSIRDHGAGSSCMVVPVSAHRGYVALLSYRVMSVDLAYICVIRDPGSR